MPGVLNNLYPPIFKKSYIPAFVISEDKRWCKITFTLSIYNSLEEINQKAVQVIVQNQRTNQSSLNKKLYPSGVKITEMTSEGNGEYSIYILNSDIDKGFQYNEFYKVQIRFTSAGYIAPSPVRKEIKDQNGNIIEEYYSQQLDEWLNSSLSYFSEWSTVLLIKPISEVNISLRHFSLEEDIESVITTNNITISGVVSQSDINDFESYRSYRIYFYDNNGFLLEDSGDQYFQNSTEIQYNCKYDFQSGQTYSLILHILTENLYLKQIIKVFNVNYVPYSSFQADISAEIDNKKGCAVITLKNKTLTLLGTNLVIRRTSSKSNFKYWEDVYTTLAQANSFLDFTWEDYTIESGVWYKYSVVKRNKENYRSLPIEIKNPIMGDFEEIFLTTKDNQLKIKFDPQISNYSRVVSESLTETIGSKYPYIRRNGRTNYRTFTISGTISYLMDIQNNLMHSSQEELYGESATLYKNYNVNNNINYFNDFIQQKNFRQKVLDFLYENNVKLYKSATQGNILVKLMNITLTPNNSLGRRIYTFNCTAYEIDDFNYENCIKYDIQDKGEYIQEEKILIDKFGQIIIPIQDKYWTDSNGTQQLIETKDNLYFGQQDILTKFIKPKFQGLETDLIEIHVTNISYLRIALTSNPYPIIYGGANGSTPIPLPPNDKTSKIVCIGHIMYINNTIPIIIGKHGIYELTDVDTEITSLNFVSDKQQGEINFEVKIEQSEKIERQTVSEYKTFSRIGQIWGTFKVEGNLNSNICESIFEKYYFEDDLSKYKQEAQNITGLRIQSQPGTIVYVRESQDAKYQKHVLNETGLLQFYDKDTNITGFYFGGPQIYFNQINNVDNGIKKDEFYDTKKVATLDMIKNPKNNYVYHIPPFDRYKKILTLKSNEIVKDTYYIWKATNTDEVGWIEEQKTAELQYDSFERYIFHDGIWYPFSDNNAIQFENINAIIDYQCNILGERYV